MGRKSQQKRIKKQENQSGSAYRETGPKFALSDVNRTILYFLLLAVVILGVYATSINHEFVWDDVPIIKNNPDIKSFSNTFKLILSADAIQDSKSYYYRPVTYLSFMTDYALWKLNPKGYHAINILLHLAFTCLLYLFARDILASSRAALATALLFGLHPVATETVNFIAGGRNTLLCGVFLLSALISHRKDRLPLAMVFFGLSAFSKEFGLLFPVIAALTDRTFPRAANNRRRDIRTYALYAAVAVFYLSMRAYVVGSGIDLELKSLPGRILMIPKIIDTYLKVLVFPHNLTAPYYFQPPGGITKEVLFYTAVLVIIVALLYVCRRFATVGFSSLWFFIFILPVLNVIPLGEFAAAERYIYIASAGFAILLGALSKRFTLPISVFGVILLCILYSIAVVNRNPIWKNDVALFGDAVVKSPDCPLAHNNLGFAYLDQGLTDEAINECRIAIKLKPGFADTHINLGNAYYVQGWLNEAISEYQNVVKLKPDFADAHYNLGIAYKTQGKINEAINEYQAAIKIKPNFAEARYNLGIAYVARGLAGEAIHEYQSAMKIKPDIPGIHYDLGIAYEAQGKTNESIDEYQAAIKIKPDFAQAHNNLGNAYYAQGRTDEAIHEYQTAIKIIPGFAGAHYNLGNTYLAQGRTDEAINEYQTAIKIKPDFADAHYKLGDAYKILGKTDEATKEYQLAFRLKPGNEAHENPK